MDSSSYISSDSDSDDFETLSSDLERVDTALKKCLHLLHAHEQKHKHKDLFNSLLRDSLHTFLPTWKEEGRLSPSGHQILLNEKEAFLLKLQPGWVSVYAVCLAMQQPKN